METYRKYKAFFVALASVLAAGALLVLDPASDGNGLTLQEALAVAAALTGPAAVLYAPNVPGAKYTKPIMQVIGALAVLPLTFYDGAPSVDELLFIATIVASALGVGAAKNEGDTYSRLRSAELTPSLLSGAQR